MEEGEATPKRCSQVRVWPGSPLQSGETVGPKARIRGHIPTAMARTAGRRTAAARMKGARAVGETPTVVSDDGEGGVGSNGGGERGA